MALAAVCIFWGTTYLGIRMALESFPPALLLGTRFTLSGAIMVLGSLLVGARLPKGQELFGTAVCGLLTIGIGTGALVWAEQWIPSGLAALFVTISPFWMIGLDAIIPPRVKPRAPIIGCMCVGLVGTALLVGPSAIEKGIHGPILRGFLTLQLGSWGWSLGSMLQRRQKAHLHSEVHPVVSGAVQQLVAGVAVLLPAMLLPHAPVHWTGRGIGAIVYLAVFGSIVGYSAFIYSIHTLPVSVVSIYNYVNPVIALLLGWLFYREPIGWREWLGMLIIFTGVALVKRFGSQPTASEKIPEPQTADDLAVEAPRTAV